MEEVANAQRAFVVTMDAGGVHTVFKVVRDDVHVERWRVAFIVKQNHGNKDVLIPLTQRLRLWEVQRTGQGLSD